MTEAPFDPIAPLAAEFHADAHRGAPCQNAAATCPIAVTLAIELRARLAAQGLVIAPQSVIDWASRLLAGADAEAVDEQPLSPDATPSERRSREIVWVRLRHRDRADLTRLGPYERWLGELVLGDLGWSHGPDVIGAMIEPEAPWIGDLLGAIEG